jgi:hypothetical protein
MRQPFVFDWMEPERPKVDRAVLDFVRGHVFDPADFVIRADGVCRLNPEMARMVVGRVSTYKEYVRTTGVDVKWSPQSLSLWITVEEKQAFLLPNFATDIPADLFSPNSWRRNRVSSAFGRLFTWSTTRLNIKSNAKSR